MNKTVSLNPMLALHLALPLVLLSVQTAPAREKHYSITHLGDIPGKNIVAPYRNAINERGQVAGQGFNGFVVDEQAFVWSDEPHLLASFPGGILSRAQALNDRGQIAGEIAFSIADRRAVVWERGAPYELPPAPGVTFPSVNVVFGINNRGDAVGSSRSASGGPQHAVLWHGGEAVILPTLPGALTSFAFSINDSGEVAGIAGASAPAARAVYWSGGEVFELPRLGGDVSRAHSVNNRSAIAGSAALANGLSHAVLWRDGVAIDLGTLGGTTSVANSSNTKGQVVGNSGTVNSPSRAFVWEAGVMQDLNDLIPPQSGWELQSAEGINNQGIIAGFGLFEGAVRGFVLTPISE